jgi:hypothetical protein
MVKFDRPFRKGYIINITLSLITIFGIVLFINFVTRMDVIETQARAQDPYESPPPPSPAQPSPRASAQPSAQPSAKPSAQPTVAPTVAPTPCPPYPPDSTEVISLTWTDEASITIPLPIIGDLEVPLDWTIEGSATFEINNTNPSIKIPDEIEINSGNVDISVSLPAIVVSVSVSAESSAELINAEFFASACGDGGVMAKFKADAEARIEVTLSVSILFWGTDVYTWEFSAGDNVSITINSACVYCPKGGNE